MKELHPGVHRPRSLRNDIVHAMLVAHDDVRIALDDRNLSRLGDGGAGDIEGVQLIAFGKQPRLGRVDVLRRAFPLQRRQNAAAKRDSPPLRIANREDQPPFEPVENSPPLALAQ